MLICWENPWSGSLKTMPWMKELNHYLTRVDYCQYRTSLEEEFFPTQKPTGLYTNIQGWRPKLCNHPRHDSVLIGRMDGSNKPLPLWRRHSVPFELHLDLVKAAMSQRPTGKFVLNLFSGTQSFSEACLHVGLKYVSADCKSQVYTGIPGRRYVVTDLCEDLRAASLEDLISRAAKSVGCKPCDLLLVWASTPCTTYTQIQRLQPPARRHRLGMHAQTAAAQMDDLLTMHWAKQLLAAMRDEFAPTSNGSGLAELLCSKHTFRKLREIARRSGLPLGGTKMDIATRLVTF